MGDGSGVVVRARRMGETRSVPLEYDPRDVLGWLPKPGVYSFRVLACEPTLFRTGSKGVRVELSVDAGGRSPLRVWDNIVFSERTTWKMYDLCRATGVRFDPPCEAEDLLNNVGRAEFEVHEHEGLLNLKVVRYLVRE